MYCGLVNDSWTQTNNTRIMIPGGHPPLSQHRPITLGKNMRAVC
jgi:hypothetical protein